VDRAPRRLASALALALAPLAGAGELEVHGVAAGRVIANESRAPGIDGGFGRLTEGRGGDAFDTTSRGE
jgi:hypothetical protein